MPRIIQSTLTPLQRHFKRWENCIACPLCETRKHVVLLRGVAPCDVLFIGEAPGKSEDNLGSPFVGPAGQLLDRIIERSGFNQSRLTKAFTNLIACIPLDPYSKKKVDEPSEESIDACQDRLEEVVLLCRPRAIICVGDLAAKYVPKRFGTNHAERFDKIIHPAAILRADVTKQELLARRAAVSIEDVVRALT